MSMVLLTTVIFSYLSSLLPSTALTGAVSHFTIGGMPELIPLVACILSTLLWARVAALIANKVSAEKLNRTLGIVLTVLGASMLVFQWVF